MKPPMRCVLSFAVWSSVLAIACIPHPADDFQDYGDKTADLRKAPEQDAAAPVDAAPPVKPVNGIYFGVCYSQLSAGRQDRVLRFYTETSFVPSATGGALTLRITPLMLPADPTKIEEAIFGKAAKRGDTFTVNAAPVDAKGLFTANFGTVFMPKEVNPISGRLVELRQATFTGRYADTKKFCAKLSGQLVQPSEATFTADANTCLFLESKEGDPYPNPELKEYVCNTN